MQEIACWQSNPPRCAGRRTPHPSLAPSHTLRYETRVKLTLPECLPWVGNNLLAERSTADARAALLRRKDTLRASGEAAAAELASLIRRLELAEAAVLAPLEAAADERLVRTDSLIHYPLASGQVQQVTLACVALEHALAWFQSTVLYRVCDVTCSPQSLRGLQGCWQPSMTAWRTVSTIRAVQFQFFLRPCLREGCMLASRVSTLYRQQLGKSGVSSDTVWWILAQSLVSSRL